MIAKDHFIPTESFAKKRYNIRHREQFSSKRLDDFLSALTDLVIKAYDGTPEAAKDGLPRDYFISGLRIYNIRHKLIEKFWRQRK